MSVDLSIFIKIMEYSCLVEFYNFKEVLIIKNLSNVPPLLWSADRFIK